jgi:hypothetical protein
MNFQVIKPEYVFLKITPNNSIRNQSTYKVARSINTIYKNVFRRIDKNSFKMNEKVSYFIYAEKNKVEFYFIVPKQYEKLFEEKLLDVWENVTIEYANSFPYFGKNAEINELTYDKEDALSLATDRRSNDLLRSNLNIINVLEENDRIGLFYNFLPTSQKGWKHKYKYTIDRFNKHEPVDRNKGKTSYILKYGVVLLTSLMNDILSLFSDEKKAKEENMFDFILDRMKGQKELSKETKIKENAQIIKSQIIAISDSVNQNRKRNNIKSITQSYETISGDNKLVAKKVKTKFIPTKYMINGAQINYVSDEEANSFISLAGRDILEEYNFIEKVETRETQVPEELRKGTMCIGENTFRGNKQSAYLSTDYNFKFLALILIGPNRAGKSTLIGNLGKDALNNNECVINFDFIKNCELSDEMSSLFPDEKILNIVCDKESMLQGLGYNEVEPTEDAFQQYANAKLQTTQLTTFVNSINSSDQPLTTRMERYLQSAANIVFISNGSMKDVFDVLQNHNTRHKFISNIPEQNYDDLQEYVDYLMELDETKENRETKEVEIVGTRFSRIDGIIDRLNKLKANPYMEKMLKKDTKNNVNLVEEFQKAQLINIRMPESMFSTDEEKDIYTTYWITKVDLALKMRGKKYPDRKDCRKVNLFIDELYQVEHTEKFITNKLSRWPKFNIKPIISCHYLNQIKYIREELRSANASYMLIAGCDKKNFKELESELYPYQETDLLNLKRFHSLNLIKTKDGYGKFITRMPDKIK